MIEEKQAKRPKALKDRFTPMPTINTTGDALLKPLPVSHSENLRALNGIDNNTLPVLFCSRPSSWNTQVIFFRSTKVDM